MWYRVELMSNQLQRAVNNMDSEHWIVLSVVAFILGMVFLRGFGSRTNY
jgi:hypothetical protein